jgi:sulfate transport system permease protein
MATTALERSATLAPRSITRATGESATVRWTLTAIALGFLLITLVLPLVLVFSQALSKGLSAYWEALTEPDAFSAARLTLLSLCQ